jgi:hypothetical protein
VVDTQVAQRPATAPPSRNTSIVPAACVLGLAVVTLIVFGLMNMIGSAAIAPTTLPAIVGGAPVDTSSRIFSAWPQGGEPPSDITAALVVPVGARLLGSVTTGGSSSDFDREVRIAVPDLSRSHVLGFYRTHFEGLGWHLYSTSSNGNGVELLFQKGGSDGFYWEAGVNAASTSPTSATYTYRLFQVSDFS